ncbi:MAG: hypothetical protein WED09_06920 [Homoserinimonas sp.]
MPRTFTPEFDGLPDVMPVLSPGKHRNPRQGACFMEFASYLAGERWSDHPPCTHPLLAFLARGVNDFSSDEARNRLVPLIPSVIGLDGDDPKIDLLIALRAASCAIPVASESRQRALATGLLSCKQVLGEVGLADDARVTARIDDSLAAAPNARDWAWEFDSLRGKHRRSLSFTRAGRAIVSTAVLGIAQACIGDSDDRLYELLSLSIEDTIGVVGLRTSAPAPVQQPQLPVFTS